MKPSPLRIPLSTLLAAGSIALAALVAYHNSFSGPLIFDDLPSIRDNPTIRHLWPIGPLLNPPPGMTVDSRPVLNLSLAINYAISGLGVGSYHAFNLLIHILAGLTLFGIVRRTLEKVGMGGPPVRGQPQGQAEVTDGRAARPYRSTLVAFATALIWTVHPLQTESVTYIIQRAESLMGLFYLLTLYCFIRAAETGPLLAAAKRSEDGSASCRGEAQRRRVRFSIWFWLSIAACLPGMATKEVMVTAPLMVLIYDRIFLAGSFGEAWRLRRRYYLGLAGTWLLLGWLVARAGLDRGGSAELGGQIGWWPRLLTQFPVVVRYLRLSLWPHPLVFDYGIERVDSIAGILPEILVVLLLVAGALAALRRGSAWGFLGAWFFGILAPSSLMSGLRQMASEHRMYLSLIPVVIGFVLGLEALIGWVTIEAAARRRWLLALSVLTAAGLAVLTVRRNQIYGSEIAFWRDAVIKRPDNPFSHVNLGIALEEAGKGAEAVAEDEAVVRLRPDLASGHNNLGLCLLRVGRVGEGIRQLQTAVRIDPNYIAAHTNLAIGLAYLGDWNGAAAHYAVLVRLTPGDLNLRVLLADALVRAGRNREAVPVYRFVLQAEPGRAEVHNNLGVALRRSGDLAAARAQFAEALRLRPDYRAARDNLAELPRP